jgi:pimeloyl-ACP methyl ester carboxylesterase
MKNRLGQVMRFLTHLGTTLHQCSFLQVQVAPCDTADVTNLMGCEDLRDIAQVGDSYGGIVVRHVADRMPDRIRSLVYLDAFVPENGKLLCDYTPDKGKDFRERQWPTAMAGNSRR